MEVKPYSAPVVPVDTGRVIDVAAHQAHPGMRRGVATDRFPSRWTGR